MNAEVYAEVNALQISRPGVGAIAIQYLNMEGDTAADPSGIYRDSMLLMGPEQGTNIIPELKARAVSLEALVYQLSKELRHERQVETNDSSQGLVFHKVNETSDRSLESTALGNSWRTYPSLTGRFTGTFDTGGSSRTLTSSYTGFDNGIPLGMETTKTKHLNPPSE